MIGAIEAGLQLRESWWLLLLLGVPVLLWLRGRRRAALPIAAVWRDARLPRSWRQRLVRLPDACDALAVALVLLAAARPVVVEVEPPRRLGRDVLLCVDRSSSMAARDLSPEAGRSGGSMGGSKGGSTGAAGARSPATGQDGESRLAVGKRVAAEFVAARRDDRVGVVAFARYADLVCPPTADHDACRELLGDVRLVDAEGPEDATAIGAAVAMAAELLLRSDQRAGKVIVLLTDGEENVAVAGAPEQIPPLHAAQWCRDRGVRVHTIALGRGEARPDGSWRALDTTAVQQLAQLTGGRFFAAADAAALRAVYAAIDRLEAARYAEPGHRVVEWFAAPALLGLLLLLLAHGWRNGRVGGLS